jgi:hydroxyacylglutathione hydrolase
MPKLQVFVIPVTPFQQNCSLVFDAGSKRGAIVDPGGDLHSIEAAIGQAGVTVEKILLTHGHLDHAGAAADLRDRLGVPVEGPHRDDKFLLDTLDVAGERYGLQGFRPVTPDLWLEHDDIVDVAGMEFRVIHAPGHSPGSVVFFNAENKFALMGDVLFQGSIGRTDLPRADHATLIASIKGRILPLGDEVVFLPGHGEASSIGDERRSNPFLQD